jgi:hypothetical protein
MATSGITKGFGSPPPGAERRFGLLFAGVFAVVGLLPLWGAHPVRWWALAVAAVFLAAALIRPRILAPLNFLWFQLGELLHHITNPILLGLVFFLSVTPIGLLMRAFGKDILSLKRRPELSSYWIERAPPSELESMKNQF